MNFINLSRRIQSFAGCDVPPLEDILGMMSMLCDDVRFETGTLVEKCPVKNWELLIERLYTISYTINFIYQKHQREITEFDASEAENHIWKNLKETEKKCEAVREQLAKLEDGRKRSAEAEEKLQQSLADQREKQTELIQCQQRIAQMEQDLEHIKNSDLLQLEKVRARLESETEACRRQLQASQQECTRLQRDLENLQASKEEEEKQVQLKEKAVLSVKEDLQKIRIAAEEAEKLQEKLEQEKASYNATVTAVADCQENLNIFREDNERIRQDLEQMQGELAEVRKEKEAWEQALAECKKELSALGKECDDTNVLIVVKNRDVEKKQRELNEKKRELKNLDDQLSEITISCSSLLDDIQKRREQLEGMDQNAIELELIADKEALQARLDDMNSKKSQIESIQEQLKELDEKIGGEQKELDGLVKIKTEKEEKFCSLRSGLECLRKDLELLASEEYQNRVIQCRERIEVLQQLRANMEQNARTLECGWEFDLSTSLQNQVASAEKTIQDLQCAIVRYAQQWQAELDG